MERSVAEEVFAKFDERMRQTIPYFKKETDKGVPKECRVYKWCSQSLFFFVQVQVHRSEDSFTVELAWSQKNRWPVVFNIEPILPDEPLPEEARFRLCRLWLERDAWWPIKRPGFLMGALTRGRRDPIEVQVEDSIQRLLEYGLPYFRRVAATLGTTLDEDGQSP